MADDVKVVALVLLRCKFTAKAASQAAMAAKFAALKARREEARQQNQEDVAEEDRNVRLYKIFISIFFKKKRFKKHKHRSCFSCSACAPLSPSYPQTMKQRSGALNGYIHGFFSYFLALSVFVKERV